MTRRNPKDRLPTTTHLVMAYLVQLADFAPVPAIAQAVGRTQHQVTSALHSLRGYQAVDAVESEGRLFWFATPASDKRERTMEQRAEEAQGSRAPRKPRARRVP